MIINGKKLKLAIKRSGITQQEAADKLEIARQTLSVWGKSEELNPDIIKNVKTKLGIDLYSFNEDEINLQLDEVKNVLNEPPPQYNIRLIKGIQVPIYDIEFAPGVLSTLIEKGDKHFPVGYLSIPQVSGCDAIIRVKDDSMEPKINNGDWIGVKRIDNWQDWLPMNYIYTIVTDSLEIVKYLRKSSDPGSFILGSPNSAYPDDELPKKQIKEIWAVKTILPFSKMETLI